MSEVICVCRITKREGSIIAGQRETGVRVSIRMIMRMIRR